MTYGYIRVSTESQNTENQRDEIIRFCADNRLHIDCWIEDVVSGTKEPTERRLGKIIMKDCRPGDLIICTELSRLGRSLLMIMNTLHYFLEHKVYVWTIKDNFRLNDDITCKVISFAFGLAAEIERQLISQRTKAALQRVMAEGKHVGRPRGRFSTHHKLAYADDYIVSLWKSGRTRNSIAKELYVSWDTVDRTLRRLKLLPLRS